MTTIKNGDVAREKAGGPNMTVEYELDDQLYCQWFAGVELRNGCFPRTSLVLVKNNA